MRRSLLLLLCLTAPVGAQTLIERAYEAGTLDLETALLYQVQSLRDPEAVPPQYREEPARPFRGTPILVQAMQATGQLGPAYGQRLAKALARPSSERQPAIRLQLPAGAGALPGQRQRPTGGLRGLLLRAGNRPGPGNEAPGRGERWR